jgi:hypothetical protein
VARIVLGSYMVRYPLGGMMSWVLQYLSGFRRLGHDIYFVEKSGYANSCFNPSTNTMGDDCSYGCAAVDALLTRLGLGGRWCYVDAEGRYYGLSRERVETVFKSADVFIDMGTHGSWLDEAAGSSFRVLIDGEPGFTQMKLENQIEAGVTPAPYDFYYTTGRNIGTASSGVPTAGLQWRPIFHPVDIDLFPDRAAPADAPFTTVMNWQSYSPVQYRGSTYGHKDAEFAKFVGLPAVTEVPFEIAVSGRAVPAGELLSAGWGLRNAHGVTRSFDSFVEYIVGSRGEFSVCKSGYVRTRCGWFSDRSAAYLACGRPVVQQDTGFGAHLPCGRGVFAAGTLPEAAEAIGEITRDYARHAKWAREIAATYLDARAVLAGLLRELGI